jgi:hypothetical protein
MATKSSAKPDTGSDGDPVQLPAASASVDSDGNPRDLGNEDEATARAASLGYPAQQADPVDYGSVSVMLSVDLNPLQGEFDRPTIEAMVQEQVPEAVDRLVTKAVESRCEQRQIG